MLKFIMLVAALWMLVLQNTCDAAEINCYSGKTRIYHGYGHTFTFGYNAMSFIENKTGHLLVFSGDCIVLVPLYERSSFDAIDIRQES